VGQLVGQVVLLLLLVVEWCDLVNRF